MGFGASHDGLRILSKGPKATVPPTCAFSYLVLEGEVVSGRRPVYKARGLPPHSPASRSQVITTSSPKQVQVKLPRLSFHRLDGGVCVGGVPLPCSSVETSEGRGRVGNPANCQTSIL